MRIHRVAALNHLVAAVAIDVGHTQLMELGRPGRLVVAAPGVRVVPVGGRAASPVVVPGEHIVMVGLVVVAVQTLHDQRGVNAVEIADGEVAVHGRIAVAHVAGTVGARVAVGAVVNLVVFQFAAVNLLASQAVDDADIERTVAHRLCAVVHDAVAIHVGHAAAHGILAPRLVLLVPEAGAVAAAHHHLTASVAVDVPCYHHVVLSATDVHVRSHVHRPQQFARKTVGLNLVACRGGVLRILLARGRTGIEAVDHHGIILAVAVGVHGPAELRAVVVAANHLVVEVNVQPHIGPRLRLVEERLAHWALYTLGGDGRHGILRIVCQ